MITFTTLTKQKRGRLSVINLLPCWHRLTYWGQQIALISQNVSASLRGRISSSDATCNRWTSPREIQKKKMEIRLKSTEKQLDLFQKLLEDSSKFSNVLAFCWRFLETLCTKANSLNKERAVLGIVHLFPAGWQIPRVVPCCCAGIMAAIRTFSWIAELQQGRSS